MREPTWFRRKNRLHGQERVYFRERSVAFLGRIENVKLPVAPAAERTTAEQRVAAVARDAPYIAAESDSGTSIDRVKKSEIARQWSKHNLNISSGIKALDHDENLGRATTVYQVDCPLAIQHGMGGMQPKACFVR